MNEFGYLIDKIRSASFIEEPFHFLVIENFLNQDHFGQVVSADEVTRPEFSTTEKMIRDLKETGYEVQLFPGCTTSIKEYLKCYNSKKWPVDKGILEGFGLTFRLKTYKTPLLSRLVLFLNTPQFKAALEEKFGITSPNYVETAIQKYLHGYEISPHPDIRKKALTYMLNINSTAESEQTAIHTHLLRFKNERRYIYEFWKYNQDIERCWVPWDWCESVRETNLNNSITIFSPSNDTLHAVKLKYDHLKFQRTQVYGNLWYDTSVAEYDMEYRHIDLLGRKTNLRRRMIKSIPEPVKKVLKKYPSLTRVFSQWCETSFTTLKC